MAATFKTILGKLNVNSNGKLTTEATQSVGPDAANVSFIFPGNIHHAKTQKSLTDPIKGSGLAVTANAITQHGGRAIPLPVRGMIGASFEEQARLASEGIAKLWNAIGNNTVVLPVRPIPTKEGEIHYFSDTIDGAYEPSFWGQADTQANPTLADYYLHHIKLAKAVVNKTSPETAIPEQFRTSYENTYALDKTLNEFTAIQIKHDLKYLLDHCFEEDADTKALQSSLSSYEPLASTQEEREQALIRIYHALRHAKNSIQQTQINTFHRVMNKIHMFINRTRPLYIPSFMRSIGKDSHERYERYRITTQFNQMANHSFTGNTTKEQAGELIEDYRETLIQMK